MPDLWRYIVTITIVGCLCAAAVFLGGRLVVAVFRMVDRAQSGAPGKPSLVAAGELLRGGAWVGLLERIAIMASLLAHYPDGMAVALAVKALARYPELKAPSSGAAERFIIGTFVSVLVAAGASGLAMITIDFLWP